jgi:hypothetical protein
MRHAPSLPGWRGASRRCKMNICKDGIESLPLLLMGLAGGCLYMATILHMIRKVTSDL